MTDVELTSGVIREAPSVLPGRALVVTMMKSQATPEAAAKFTEGYTAAGWKS